MSDSNQRHPLCKSGATTAELISHVLCLGIEPSIQVHCLPVLTNRLPEGKVMSAHHQRKTLSATFTALEGSEDMIESDISNPINCPTWTRTKNPRVNSSVLCQLSYRAILEEGLWYMENPE